MPKRALRAIAAICVAVVLAPFALQTMRTQGRDELAPASSPVPSEAAAGRARTPAPRGPSGADARSVDVASATVAIPQVSEWRDRFRGSSDHAAFVRDALPAALHGDAEAQYCIFAALRGCAPVLPLYAESAELGDVIVRPGFTESSRRHLSRLWTLCEGFRTGDPLAGAVGPPDPRLPATWLARAAANGHVLAQAVDLWSDTSVSEARRRAAAIELARGVDRVRDPWAMLYLGAVVAGLGPDSLQIGAAMMLAACDLGAPCAEGDTESVIQTCQEVDDPSCIPGGTVADVLQREVGAERFARIYALAVELRGSMSAGEAGVLQRALGLAAAE